MIPSKTFINMKWIIITMSSLDDHQVNVLFKAMIRGRRNRVNHYSNGDAAEWSKHLNCLIISQSAIQVHFILFILLVTWSLLTFSKYLTMQVWAGKKRVVGGTLEQLCSKKWFDWNMLHFQTKTKNNNPVTTVCFRAYNSDFRASITVTTVRYHPPIPIVNK